jgi:membrane protein DedA with SNARE-associated domain
MEQFVQSLLDLSDKMGHLGVFFLMILESTFIPIPSELVIPPAAFLAHFGKMNIFLVVAAGVGGSVVGALINYYLALYLGRPIIYAIAQRHFMRYLFITHHKLQKAEEYFVKHGNISTFIGRLIPGIRHLISIPAGFSRMPLKSFILYTFLGSFLWVSVLSVAGYVLALNEAFFKAYFWQLAWTSIALIIILVVAIYVIKTRKKS